MGCVPDTDIDGITVANCDEGEIVDGVGVPSSTNEDGGTVDVLWSVGDVVDATGSMVAATGDVAEGTEVALGLGVSEVLSGDHGGRFGWH